MPSRRAKFKICSVLLTISLGILVHGVSEAAITFEPLLIDVTPVNFAVVWATSEPATCSVNVFLDADGTTPYTEAVVISESGAHPPAEDRGVMKVHVGGLKSDTTYYYQIITVSNEGVLVEPASGPLPSVHTEYSAAIVITNNGSLAHRVLESDGATPADGTLVVAEIPGASSPITAWAGEYSTFPGWAFLVLDNLYDQASVYGNGGHVNLRLLGGETVTLTSIGGSIGFRRLSGTLPQELGGTVELDPKPSDDDCTLDVAGPIIEAAQIEPVPNGFINSDIPLIKGAYHDAALYSEIDTDSVRLLVDGEDVTANATVDSTTVEYTPVTPLAEGSHDVTLEVADEWGNEADPFSWTFTVNVANSVNDPPVANDDSYSVDEDSTLNVALPGVVENDTDTDGDQLSAVLVSNVSNGTLTLNGDGSFTYTPNVNFTGTDIFTYQANDTLADSNVATVIITVGSDADNDGIPDREEYGPDGTDNLYDGNKDNIPDNQQDNVASFHTHDRRSYVTLAVLSPVGATLSRCRAISPPAGAPSGMSFPYGFFDFTINGAPTPPAETVVRLFLPDGDTFTSYYKYGQTPGNQTDHWYEFLYDGETGAEINGNVFTLYFVDAERGDDMLLSQDGMIIDQGGPGIPASGGNTATSGGGGGGGCFIATALDDL
jgi:hypothetical protein